LLLTKPESTNALAWDSSLMMYLKTSIALYNLLAFKFKIETKSMTDFSKESIERS
jgi:hypothetical protein